MVLGAGGDAESYATAYAETEQGKPMVVLVSAEWCSPCQEMKRTIIPQVKKRGLLAKIAYVVVNVDRDRSLAKKLIGAGPIPQLIMFRKTDKGWKRKQLVGGQSVKTVEKFLDEGIPLKEPSQTKAEKG